jgi:hypothetical protein
LQRALSNSSSSTSSPPPTAHRAYTPPSPTQPTKARNTVTAPIEPLKPQPSSPLDKPSISQFSDSSTISKDSGFYDDTRPDLLNKYYPPPSSTGSSFATQAQPFGPGSYRWNASFPPTPPGPTPIEIRARDRGATDQYGRRRTEDEIRPVRDTEKWDRYQESRQGVESDRFDRPYERGNFSTEPRDSRGAPPNEWYRDKGRTADHDDSYRRYA